MPPSMSPFNMGPADLLAHLNRGRAAKTAAPKAAQAPRAAPLQILSLTLYIHIRHCKNCGAEHRVPNKHLLASYMPPHNRILGTHLGRIPQGCPLRIVHEEDKDGGPDWCESCFRAGPSAP